MIGNLDQGEIERVLRRQPIGRLGVVGGDDVYIFPVAYGYDGTDVYIHSHAGRFGGLKVELMRAHPQVCLEVEEIVGPLHWRTVLVHGRAEEVTDPSTRDAAFAAIVTQEGESAPLSIAPYIGGPEEIVVYRIRPTAMTGRYEREEVVSPSKPAGRA